MKSDLFQHIDTKTADIQIKLTNIQGSLSTLAEQVAEVENRVSTNENNLQGAADRITQLEKEMSSLKDKTQDLENRSRRSNIRLVGLPEGSEGQDTVGFVAQLIPQLVGQDHFKDPLIIERAHHSSAPKPGNADRPRPIIMKLLNFRDKERILRLAGEKSELYYNGKRMFLFPDFSIELQNKRKEFNQVKRKLNEKGVKYALTYPAKLRVEYKGMKRFFISPHEAENFVREMEKN
ncbi:LINE-1 type transposase domain-containing protein 1 [Huso huso]|uniref:LINE-1 type transposase domain-containing protein 1 n=1 Tax=Huso huso TaxID=61971 RepID=A0ABR0YSY6_HUSHU